MDYKTESLQKGHGAGTDGLLPDAVSYKTEMFQRGFGAGTNRLPSDAVKYVHDIFATAVAERMHVFVLCGALTNELRHDTHKQHTGKTFAACIRDVLKVGRDVSVLLWGSIPPAKICRKVLEVLAESDTRPAGWGTFRLRISGTGSSGRPVSHFIVARTQDRKSWIVRVEDPHPEYPAFHDDTPVHASILQDTVASRREKASSKEARTEGERLEGVFHELFDAVPDKRVELVTL